MSAIPLPGAVADSCGAFLRERGLVFGAFDFAVVGDRWVFLECNQNGEFGWLERATRAPVAEIIADQLVSA